MAFQKISCSIEWNEDIYSFELLVQVLRDVSKSHSLTDKCSLAVLLAHCDSLQLNKAAIMVLSALACYDKRKTRF